MKRGNSAVPFKELGSSPAKDMPHDPNGIPPSQAAMMNKRHAEAEHPHDLGEKTPLPAKSGLGATAAKPFDVDDLADLKEQNKAKAAELLKQYRAKKISAKEYHQKIDEMKTYENPE